MMKLYDMAMAIKDTEVKVALIDHKSRRICFEGEAIDLIDYSGIEHIKVVDVDVRNNWLELSIK